MGRSGGWKEVVGRKVVGGKKFMGRKTDGLAEVVARRWFVGRKDPASEKVVGVQVSRLVGWDEVVGRKSVGWKKWDEVLSQSVGWGGCTKRGERGQVCGRSRRLGRLLDGKTMDSEACGEYVVVAAGRVRGVEVGRETRRTELGW